MGMFRGCPLVRIFALTRLSLSVGVMCRAHVFYSSVVPCPLRWDCRGVLVWVVTSYPTVFVVAHSLGWGGGCESGGFGCKCDGVGVLTCPIFSFLALSIPFSVLHVSLLFFFLGGGIYGWLAKLSFLVGSETASRFAWAGARLLSCLEGDIWPFVSSTGISSSSYFLLCAHLDYSVTPSVPAFYLGEGA